MTGDFALFGLGKKGRKKTAKPAATESGFADVSGPHYFELLKALHHSLQPESYLEIGTQKGPSLKLATCSSVAIDPEFQIVGDVMGGKPDLRLIQQTSDDAFASGVLDAMGFHPDFAFLDGMHLLEYTLRDFINVEAQSKPGATLTIHDCVPKTQLMAERDWDKAVTREWTGDVWKMVPILRDLRPDLNIAVMDAAPTGLVVVSGLDPSNTTLQDAYDRILETYLEMRLADYGIARFFETLDMQDSAVLIEQIRQAH